MFAGVIIGLGFFALLNSLWFAVAFSAGAGLVGVHLGWFAGVTAAVSLLIAGWVAGALAGVRGTLAGLVNGIAAWGLLFILSVAAVLPGAASLAGGGMPQAGPLTPASGMWTAFWSLLVGLVLAAVGGILGGRMRRPVRVAGEPEPGQQPTAGEEPARNGTEQSEVVDGREVREGRPR
ncbi:hypothetical protein BJF90_01050 [Pseudonocardia sp. CNS-004]|nr:hypothetical protein BJF90_01050 [Pseudonocardia sp. CNS-004]